MIQKYLPSLKIYDAFEISVLRKNDTDELKILLYFEQKLFSSNLKWLTLQFYKSNEKMMSKIIYFDKKIPNINKNNWYDVLYTLKGKILLHVRTYYISL